MVKIAVLDDYQDIALKSANWASLPADSEVQVFRDHVDDVDETARRLRDFQIICTMRERTPIGRQLLGRLPALRLLTTTGMRNAAIDVDAATQLGIMVCGTGGLGYPTAELTWGLILSLARNITQEDAALRRGRWQTTIGAGLQGKVLGVLGLGRLGSQVARIGQAFGMSVIAWSQNLTPEKAAEHGAALVSKAELFGRSDIVTIHLVLSERTRDIVGAPELARMKPTAYLVNTSRGPIVDEKALVQALQAGTIAGAGLDVFDEEPLPPGHPFCRLSNAVLTPHLGYVTIEGYRVFYQETVEDIAAYLQGRPVRILNPSVIPARL